MYIDGELLLINALGFSLALVWNDAIVKCISQINTVYSPAVEYFINAVIITIIIVTVVSLINSAAKGGFTNAPINPTFDIIKK